MASPRIPLFDYTAVSAAEDLALDEALCNTLERAVRQGQGAEGYEVLRVWERPEPCVVMGVGGRRAREVNLETCAGVPVLRRVSGGGTVVLGPGCLCFSLVLSLDLRPELREIRSSYSRILEPIARALADREPGLNVRGIADLSRYEKKVSGNAQRRQKHSLLHHGTLLYDFDVRLMARHLQHPPKMPEYRQDRAHEDFVTQLEGPRSALVKALAEAWNASAELEFQRPDIAELMSQRYSLASWHEKR